MNTYHIIGDIHGRDCWKRLVRTNSQNIFVGDYLDPYDDLSYEQLMENINDILAYKQAHPDTILLYGNHDLHYILSSDISSRFDYFNAYLFQKFFNETKHLFNGAAYSINDDILVTHAGVTKEWYEKEFGEYKGESPDKVAQLINQLWETDKKAFTFSANATISFDVYGESPTHSPMWIRPWTLAEHNLFAGTPYKQIFGHTQMEDITQIAPNLVCIDCLGTQAKGILIRS